VRIDEKRPANLAAYALRTPTVVFYPGALALTAGGGAERRKLLDRIALYQSAATLGDTESYAKAMRARQRVLESRGEQARDLDGWEELAVRHGVAVSNARTAAADALIPAAQRAFARIGHPDMRLDALYERSAPRTADTFRSELASRRSRDRARRSATIGPHRDDLSLSLDGRAMRATASQGQHRAAVLALKLAEIEVIESTRGVRPVLLLDDVSSELDRERTSALFTALRDERSQVLLTTTRPKLIDTGIFSGVNMRRDFRVDGGMTHLSAPLGAVSGAPDAPESKNAKVPGMIRLIGTVLLARAASRTYSGDDVSRRTFQSSKSRGETNTKERRGTRDVKS
jgi:DNA replication and repair protein RecF